ncbi:MAG: DUF1343 domain-containing protein [Firmicutes bacterium]|nr:DUF1343 domain-containing protein [Bacillota bacterium]
MVKLGIEQLLESFRPLILHRRLGLISHYAMTDSHLVPVIDRLQHDPDVHVIRLFGPEHGVLNAARAGEPVPFMREDSHSGLPAFSLYGEHNVPDPAWLEDLDGLLIDLQDIGARYYTYISTLYYAIKAVDRAHIPLIVLDRPNPLGGIQREGQLLHPAYRSFVGILPVPIRHGLTLGEAARLIQQMEFPHAAVQVVPLGGWDRHMLWPETGLPFISVSPNVAQYSTALLYPGTCLFEGTNVSVGRGTTHPFEWIGAPWADGHRIAAWFNRHNLPGVIARPLYFTPWRSLYTGDLVSGVQLHITDPQHLQAVKTGATLLLAFRTLYPHRFHMMRPGESAHQRFFDRLAGGPALREAIETSSLAAYFAEDAVQLFQFHQDVAPSLIYPEK